jgi:DNA-binding transcriptional MocR family regulator
VEPFPFASDEPSADLLPVDELADCAATVLGRDGKAILSYGPGAGYSPLRELIASWFGTHPFNVVLTNGRLQGLKFLAEELVRGRSAAVESPADPRMLAALLGSGGSLIYVSGDRDGMITTEIEQQLIQYVRPALICLNAGFGSPTGATLSLARRRHLLEVLANFNRLGVEQLHLLEDDSFTLTRFEGERLPALFDLSGGATLYSSSFSPTIAPGVRVGWLILPDDLAARVTERASSTYISPGLLGQATVHEFISRGALEPHLTRVRQTLRERRDAMTAALAEHLPEASWTRPEGGYFVWLQLPEPLDGRAVVERAEGVTAVAGTELAVTSAYLRLSYSAVPADEIPEGIARLARAAHELLGERAA